MALRGENERMKVRLSYRNDSSKIIEVTFHEVASIVTTEDLYTIIYKDSGTGISFDKNKVICIKEMSE